MRKRRLRRITYCFFIFLAFVLSSCPSNIFRIADSQKVIQSKRYEFETMKVVSGPVVLPYKDVLQFWSWGTVQLDLSNSDVKNSVIVKLLLREDHAGDEYAKFEIAAPKKNGREKYLLLVDSQSWKLYEIQFRDIIPGIWEFSFTNDYPQERNIHADYVIFEFDSTEISPDTIRTDTLYFSDLTLPKRVIVCWDRNKEPDVRNYVAYFNDKPFNSYYVYDSVVTADTFAVFNSPWLELYARVIAVDTANNRSGFSEIVRGLILQLPKHKGDWDNDGKIDFDDLVQFCQSGVYGTSSEYENYDAIFDFDDSGWVDFDDLISFCRLYGTIFAAKYNMTLN